MRNSSPGSSHNFVSPRTFRRSALLLVWLAALFVAPSSPAAVTIDWVPIGNPGNPADTPSSNCYGPNCGSVPYTYYISKYEVTNAQYAEFLNAQAVIDIHGLYNPSMQTDETFGGITQSPDPPPYTYSVNPGFANKPVVFVSFYSALRFANWLNNGQGAADTETGAYTITPTGITNNTITRNPGATIFLPSENEWYKAAYYSPGLVYFDYPAGTNTPTECEMPTATANRANCGQAVNALTIVGAYSGSASPYGTYDQGGNVSEWNEQMVFGSSRGSRGGSWNDDFFLAAANPFSDGPFTVNTLVGFRVALFVRPIPIGDAAGPVAAVLLVMTGLLAVWRQRSV